MGLATARDSTDLRDDGPPLLAALAAVGVDGVPVSWGADVDWGTFDAVLIRATFDYVDDRDRFLAWAADVSSVTMLANPHPVLEWNTDKRYLRDLHDAGVAIVPTVWVGPDDDVDTAVFAGLTSEWVVKPAVSAGARHAARYRGAETAAALDHVRRLQRGGGWAMIQPYLHSVDERGETGTYVFGGEVSHAITKGAVLRPGEPPPDDFSLAIGQSAVAAPIDPLLAAFARKVLDALPFGPPLYARVDTVAGPGGGPLLLELELTEPYLFLDTDPGAAGRFAAVVRDWLQRRPGGETAGPQSAGDP